MTKSRDASQYMGVREPDRPPGSGRELFDAIYEAEFEYVWRTLGRMGIPEAEIPDAVHEVFLVLCRRWHEIDRERPMRPWLFGVARRVAADLRAKRRDQPLEGDVQAHPPAIPSSRSATWSGTRSRRSTTIAAPSLSCTISKAIPAQRSRRCSTSRSTPCIRACVSHVRICWSLSASCKESDD